MSSSRQQIDSVIDDDDEFCPLCIEEFDLSDKNFKPCPCGYQICQFCYNNIKTHSEEGRCPNCRRPYDDSTIQYKIPDAEEFKADLALKHRKAAAAKKKEAEKREIEASSRKNLAGVRVVQKNLVYVIGLNPTIRDENQLLQTLRGRDYFGQYGDIEKIVVSKAKPGGNPHQGIGVYVTFSRKIDAATCIAAVDGSANGDRVLRAQYGTTKYCSSFLRNEQCNNRNCTFLHETGEDSESYSRSDLSSMNTLSSQRPSHPPQPQHPPHVRPVQPITHTMRRQPSKDDSISGRSGAPDGPALPSSASWANKDATIRTRRASLTGSQASQSPRPASVTVATPVEEPKRVEKPSPVTQDAQRTSQPVSRSPTVQPAQPPSPEPPASTPFDNLVKDIMNPNFKFIFSTADLPDEEVKAIQSYPSFIDPYGGVKRRAMREKAEQERLKREQELLQSAVVEEESREAGSLQLGGEPEESNPPRGPQQSRESHGAIQPPSQQGTADNSTVGSPVSAASHQFQGLNLAGRSLTPLQQQQLMLLKSAGNQQAGIADHLSSAALDQATQLRQGLLHNQMAQFNALQGQSRQSSRFTFANDVGSKNISNARMLSQMQAGTPNPLSAPSPQHALAGGFYASGVQGPPPGLKTAGTPPISGGGMFAQGHGFTANANIGLGSNMGKHDATPELMRELLRGRGGANIGGVQGQEAAKLNEDFPPLGGLLKDSHPVDTFGFLKSQLPSDSAGRVGTPSLPPGLPLPQSHPASAVFQDQLSLSKPSSPAPTLPPGLNMDISRGGNPSENNSAAEPSSLSPEFPSRTATTSARSKDVSQISLGSPVAKSAHKARMTKLDLSTLDSPTNADQSPLIGTKGSPIPLSMHLGVQESASSKSDRVSLGTLVSGPGSVAAIGSRPNTPLTTVSRVSDSSILRQPRILRVVDTPKTEIPPPITNAPSAPVSTAKSGKTQSRRQSVSSSSRPDTPGDFGSEADLFPSASVSRASSPPATTRIGSAPVRSITKSQLKKERRQKAKEAEAKQAEVVTPEEPVQAPILGRKRKTKKAPSATTSSADSAPTTVPVPEPPVPVKTPAPSPKKMEPKPEPAKKVKEKEQPPVQETKPAPVVEQPAPPPVPPEAWRSRNTVEQLIKDAEESGRPVKDLFVERTKSLHEVLAEMHKSGELDLNKSSLFNPANLGQRTDMKGIDSDYFLLKQPLELFESHRRALMRGQPVRIDAEQLSDRCLITPRGCVLRHLSAEEEDRYLELEKNRGGAMDPFVVGDDSSNINGGLDALFATPEKYNICWVDDNSARMGATSPTGTLNTADSVIPPNVLSAMEADSERSHDWAVAHSAELLQTTTAAVRSFAAATAKQMLGSAGVPGTNPSLDDVAAMTNEELKELAGQSQKELESNRKELDVLDKKLAALLRRNKKIQQAALALAEEA
ncbi:Putative CCR4-NOT core complex subunit Not4 [Penicillium brasilianum]|uniref:Putative CCR4-NOT core complex subunit Not4 n=1 Tax=Penicillium brasilianum TaxID=104259 RepID=A0A0F7VF07_PENBI|nr:Putative CCR4-NOT core complex subunit Not4 [Penicillium brasilianum]